MSPSPVRSTVSSGSALMPKAGCVRIVCASDVLSGATAPNGEVALIAVIPCDV